MAAFELFSFNRITFGILCLILALILLVVLGLRRLRLWRAHRRQPDLRQRSSGSGYSGSHRRGGANALPYSGLGSYKGRRRRQSGRVRPLFQPPSYKGRR